MGSWKKKTPPHSLSGRRNEVNCEDEETPIVIPLIVRVKPHVVQVTLRAVMVEVEVVTVAISVHPEMCKIPSVSPPPDYSKG